MREGAALMVRGRNKHNMNYILKKLEACSYKYDECEDCPDFKLCVEAFDIRCKREETTCPECGKTVIIRKYCMECGAALKVPGRNGRTKGSENIKH